VYPILTYYNNGKSYPWLTRDELADQLPIIQKKFLAYKDYADAQLTDIFSGDQLASAKTAEVKTLESVFLQNDNNKKFSIAALPMHAQISPINGMAVLDVDKDGNKDIIIAGNFYPFRVSIGAIDAGIGLVLKGNGKGNFTAMPLAATGLSIPGDVRKMIQLKGTHHTLLIAAKNNDAVQVIRVE
jgi:hypothetical protein